MNMQTDKHGTVSFKLRIEWGKTMSYNYSPYFALVGKWTFSKSNGRSMTN